MSMFLNVSYAQKTETTKLLAENNVTDNVRLIHFEIESVLPIILRMYSSPK